LTEYWKQGAAYESFVTDGLVREKAEAVSGVKESYEFQDTFDGVYPFDKVCECVNPSGPPPFFYKNPPAILRGIWNLRRIASVEIYRSETEDQIGELLPYPYGKRGRYFMVFITPVSVAQFVPNFETRGIGPGGAGTGPLLSCSDFKSFTLNQNLIRTEPTTTNDERELSKNVVRGYEYTGPRLHAFISNYRPTYVENNLDRFFPARIAGGQYRSYRIFTNNVPGLPDLELYAHTYREPQVVTQLSYADYNAEPAPCGTLTVQTQTVPADEYAAPDIIVTAKFRRWAGAINPATGLWAKD
jgi:hypothetical protein